MAVLTVPLATPPAQPQAAATPISNIGQTPISGNSVLTVSLLIRPKDNGHGYAY